VLLTIAVPASTTAHATAIRALNGSRSTTVPSRTAITGLMQHDSAKPDEEADDMAEGNPLAVRHQLLDANHPERRTRHEHGGQPARHGLLRPHHTPVAAPDEQDAQHRQGRPRTPGRQQFAANFQEREEQPATPRPTPGTRESRVVRL